ncbi:hypothetical protein C1I98_01620 [Spongiactinospora gelatinilytica]|uniref:Uncharacterized protein n=1 Tax=Spongiactinospora gelatinilytica TaxID=2666298 RepID=A0A2W2H6E5_9ACTN|nr:hypothetical protein [Spongiactinospora gelatinilytica]PZG56241.1 hypothetical protein C1I98_01620 [Spongiactinospora gelatinilytica]
MAGIIAELLDPNEISKYLHGVSDAEETWALYDISGDPAEWITTGENGIVINERRSERCLIKYELWDDTPPLLASWDRNWTGSVRFTTGRVPAISGASGGTSYGEEFDLGRPDGDWNARVYRKSLGHEEFTPDLVSFTLLKVQFWAASP